MKKISYLTSQLLLGIAASGFMACGLASCGNSTNDNRMTFESFDYDTIAEFTPGDSVDTNNPDSKYARIYGRGVLPVTGDSEALITLRDSLENLAGIEFTEGINVVPTTSDDFLKLKITSLPPATTDACSKRMNRLDISDMTPEVIVWEDYAESYLCGAAHGLSKYSYVNYSTKESKILNLDDLFIPGYKDKVTDMIRKELSIRDDLLTPIDEIELSVQFRIRMDGIQFVYNVYEIAPYSSGAIRVDISSDALESLLSPLAKSIFYLHE